MNNTLITIKKELRGIFRDKKYLLIIFLMPLIVPAFIVFMGFLYDDMGSGQSSVGINYTLNNNELSIINEISPNTEYIQNKDEKELEKLYANNEIDAYIIKKDDTYYVYADNSTEKGMTTISFVSSYLQSYNKYLANNYLIGEDIDPNNVFNIIKIEVKDLATEGTDYFSNFLINFALTYLVLVITITAVNTTTDIVAGEKERGTFETLLTFPVKSTEIISGKFLAITISCIISSVIGIVFSIPAFIIVKKFTTMFSDMQFNISITTILLSILVYILVSLLSAGICIMLTGNAKSFKEAQSKQSIIQFLGSMPMFISLMNVSNTIMYMIPITNGGIILNDIFLGNFNIFNLLIVISSTVLYITVILFYISKQYKNEKALF